MTIGVWHPLGLRQVGSGRDLRPSTPLRPASLVLLLVATLAPGFDPLDLGDGWHLTAAEASRRLSPLERASTPSSTSRHKNTCRARWRPRPYLSLHPRPRSPRSRRLHFEECRSLDAGRRHLRMPVWDHDSACSICGEVLDRWSDHAGGATELSVTTPSVTSSALSPRLSPPS